MTKRREGKGREVDQLGFGVLIEQICSLSYFYCSGIIQTII